MNHRLTPVKQADKPKTKARVPYPESWLIEAADVFERSGLAGANSNTEGGSAEAWGFGLMRDC